MAFPIGAIPLTGAIGLTDVSDVFATHLSILGKGGHREVATIAERNAITVERREFGMTVTVNADPTPANNKTYQLCNTILGGANNTITDNSNWTTYNPAGISPISFSNGITASGGVAKLGGPLIENTLIQGAAKILTFGNTTNLSEFNTNADIIRLTRAVGSSLVIATTSTSLTVDGAIILSKSNSNNEVAIAAGISTLPLPHGGDLRFTAGNGFATGDNNGGNFRFRAGTKSNAGVDGNYVFGNVSVSAALGGDVTNAGGVVYIQGASKNPVANPAGGGILYVNAADAYKPYWRTPAGVTYDLTAGTGGGGQALIQFKDEGINLGTAGTVSAVNFVGSGVSSARVGDTVTVTIPTGASNSKSQYFVGNGATTIFNLVEAEQVQIFFVDVGGQVVENVADFTINNTLKRVTFNIAPATGTRIGIYYFTQLNILAGWGTITGTLSDQTDLNTALNDKASISGSYSNPTWITTLAASKITGVLDIGTIPSLPYWSLGAGGIITGTNTIDRNNFDINFTGTGRVTFGISATKAGLNVGASIGADPSTLVDGDIWINGSIPKIRISANSMSILHTSNASANRIPYFAGNSALVSAVDALTFDGTALLVGGGTVTANTRVDIRGISGGNALRVANDTNSTQLFNISNAGTFTLNTNNPVSVSTASWNYSVQGINISTLFNTGVQHWDLYNTSGTRLGRVVYAVPGSNGPGITFYDQILDDRYDILHNTTNNSLLFYKVGAGVAIDTRVGIGLWNNQAATATLHVRGRGTTTGVVLRTETSGGTLGFEVSDFGDARLRGALLVGSTGTITSTTSLDVRGIDNGASLVYRGANLSNTLTFSVTANGQLYALNASGIGATVVSTNWLTIGSTMSATSGTLNGVSFIGTFTPTSGTATFSGYRLGNTLDQSGGANGQIIGFHGAPTVGANGVVNLTGFEWSPTLTGSVSGTHLAWRNTSGQLLFGGTTITLGSILADFQSSTQGIVVPRPTLIANIATPTNGMIAYDNTTHKFNFRENGNWITTGSGFGGTTGTVDNAVLRADGTGGITLQSSALVIADSGDINWGLTSTGGTSRILAAVGSGPNIDIVILPKGLGHLALNGQNILLTTSTGGEIVTVADIFNFTAVDTAISTILKLFEGSTNGSNFIGIRAPNAITTSVTYTLPEAPSVDGYVLSSTVTGVMSWAKSVNFIDVTISSAEILNLNSSPKVLIPAPGAGKIIDVISVEAYLNYNSIAYATNTNLFISYNASGAELHSLAFGIAAGAFDYFTKIVLNNQNTFNTSIRVNTPLIAYISGGNPTAGNSIIKMFIAYRIITI